MAERSKFQFRMRDLLWAVSLCAVACVLGIGAWNIVAPLGEPVRSLAPSTTIVFPESDVLAVASSGQITVDRHLGPAPWFLIVATLAFFGGALGRVLGDAWMGILFGSFAGGAVAFALSVALRQGASW